MDSLALLNLLAQNYIRWRHGIIGSADQPVVAATESALSEVVGVEIAAVDDETIMELISEFDAPSSVDSQEPEHQQ